MTRLHELSKFHWLAFAAVLTITSYLIARDPEGTVLPYWLLVLLVCGFVAVVKYLAREQDQHDERKADDSNA